MLAYAYSDGHNSVPKNHKKALILFEKSCKLHNGIAPDCFSLGVLYQVGVNEFLTDIKVNPNPQKALEIYGIGCDYGDDFTCKSYAELYDKIKK